MQVDAESSSARISGDVTVEVCTLTEPDPASEETGTVVLTATEAGVVDPVTDPLEPDVGAPTDVPDVAGVALPSGVCEVQAAMSAPRPTEPPRASARRRLIRSLLAVTSSFIGA